MSLKQILDCSSANEVSLMDMGNLITGRLRRKSRVIGVSQTHTDIGPVIRDFDIFFAVSLNKLIEEESPCVTP